MGAVVNPWSTFRSAVILLNRMDFALRWLFDGVAMVSISCHDFERSHPFSPSILVFGLS